MPGGTIVTLYSEGIMQKDAIIKFRLTQAEKSKLDKYCKKNGTNYSAVIRQLLDQLYN